MELWARFTALLLRLIDQFDVVGIAVLIFVEEAGVPSPVPGDLAMMLAGYRVTLGKTNFFEALVMIELATILGASILYWLAARGGRPLIYKYGHLIHLNRERLETAEAQLRKYGARSIVLGRIVPGL